MGMTTQVLLGQSFSMQDKSSISKDVVITAGAGKNYKGR
jgi:hypothetical protein